MPAAENLLVDQLLDRQIFRHNGVAGTHGLCNAMARQQASKRNLLYLDGSSVVQEQADERNPKPTTKIAADHLEGPVKISWRAQKRPTLAAMTLSRWIVEPFHL